jgi:hypothetical protein
MHMKDEPYKVSKITEGRLRSIVSLDWALAAVTSANFMYHKDDVYCTIDQVLALMVVDGKLGTAIGLDPRAVVKIRHAKPSVSLDVKGWDKSIPRDVMVALYRDAPNKKQVLKRLFKEPVYALPDGLFRYNAHIWPSGSPATLAGNSIMHAAILLTKLDVNDFTVMGDDCIVTRDNLEKAKSVYASFNLDTKLDGAPEFCGLDLDYTKGNLQLSIREKKIIAKARAREATSSANIELAIKVLVADTSCFNDLNADVLLALNRLHLKKTILKASTAEVKLQVRFSRGVGDYYDSVFDEFGMHITQEEAEFLRQDAYYRSMEERFLKGLAIDDRMERNLEDMHALLLRMEREQEAFDYDWWLHETHEGLNSCWVG